MKLNNGKGWEAMKTHPSAAHLNHGIPNSSARELHGQSRTAKTPIPRDRLDQDLPKPGTSRTPGGGRHPQRRGESGGAYDSNTALAGKRQSTQDFRHPEGSTVAQFQTSQPQLGTRNSMAQPNMQQSTQQGQQPRGGQEEQKMTPMQKIMKVLCCG